jgi:ABC-type nitrate/sulfonate/bicarbonate transport system ATPase subunit
LASQKNKHLTLTIFGGALHSWRATRKAEKINTKQHANFHSTAENRLAIKQQNYSLLQWLTIWKADNISIFLHITKQKNHPIFNNLSLKKSCTSKYNKIYRSHGMKEHKEILSPHKVGS